MKIYLLRHGIAQTNAHPHPRADFERQLTQKGIERLHFVFKKEKKLFEQLNAIYASPLVRAQQTADIALGYTPCQSFETYTGLNYICPIEESLNLIRSLDSQQEYLLIGHNPHLVSLASALIHGPTIPMVLKKGGLIELQGDMQTGFYLSGLIAPKHFL